MKIKKLIKIKNKAYLFLLPSIIGFSILYLIPFLDGIRYSFGRSSFDSTFVGLENYINVLDSGAFLLALKNTGIFMGISIPLIIAFSFIIALLIYELKAPKIIKLFIILPISIPSATVAGFFRKLLDTGSPSLLDSEYAMLGAILIFIWKNTGYNLIIYLAGLTQLDRSSMEAARMDGAGYFKILRHIVIPLLTPATVFVAIVTVINSFKVFKDVYILQGSYPNPGLYMLQHYMNNKFTNLQYESLTSAAYLFTAVIYAFAIALFILDRKFGKKVGEV